MNVLVVITADKVCDAVMVDSDVEVERGKWGRWRGEIPDKIGPAAIL